MKKILVCQHVAHEILGTLNPLFKEHGFRIRYANFGRHPDLKIELDDYEGLVVLGGPMNVDETVKHPHLAHEIELIQKALEKKIPTLGICLGAQLIAKALGEKVARHHTKEIGWYDLHLTESGKKDPLFFHFETMEKIFQWHGDTFDIPKGAIHLARSPLCENQAFRYRENVYGVQFHMEVDEPLIQRWLTVGVNKQELDDSGGIFSADRIAQETHRYIGRLKKLGTQSFNAFIELFGVPKKFRRFSSR